MCNAGRAVRIRLADDLMRRRYRIVHLMVVQAVFDGITEVVGALSSWRLQAHASNEVGS